MAAKINISQAARMFNKDRKTIHRAIERHNISTEKSEDGQTLVQLVDLISVWGEPKNPSTPTAVGNGEAQTQYSTPGATPFFEEKINLLEEQITELRQDKEHFKEKLENESESRKELEKQLIEIVQQHHQLMLEDKRKSQDTSELKSSSSLKESVKLAIVVGVTTVGTVSTVAVLLFLLLQRWGVSF